MIDKMFGRFAKLAVTAAALGVIGLGSPRARAQSRDNGADGGGWFDGSPAPAASSSAAPKQTLAGSTAQGSSDTYTDTDPSALTDFRATLSPYGHWVQDPSYGLVWVPEISVVGPNFAPYLTSGHWAVTPSGDWTWVSDYPFGWVVFHYGRWVWIAGTGWAWIAGRRYANAWVEWRLPDDGYDYIGWAPLPPAWGWWDGAAVELWFAPPAAYVFCPSDDLFDDDMPRHIVHDRDRVGWVGRHSHRYRTPSGGVPRHAPAFSQAHVPARVVPAHRTAANPRALEASRPSTASRAFHGAAAPTRWRSRRASSARTVRSTRVYRPSSTFSSRRIYSPARRVYVRPPRYTGFRSPRYTGFRSPRYTGFRSPRYTGFRSPRYTGFRSPRYTGFRSPTYRFNWRPAPERFAPGRSFVRTPSFSRARVGGFHGSFRGGFVHAVRGRR